MTDPDEEWERALAAWERLEREVDAQAKQEAPTLAPAEAGGGDDSLERQLEAELDAHMQLPRPATRLPARPEHAETAERSLLVHSGKRQRTEPPTSQPAEAADGPALAADGSAERAVPAAAEDVGGASSIGAAIDAAARALPPHLAERTRLGKPWLASGSEVGGAQPVVYWLRKTLRAHEHPGLDVAIAAANHLRRPLLVLVTVEDRYAQSTARRQTFLLEGCAHMLPGLRRRGLRVVTHVSRVGHRQRPILTLAWRHAILIVCEEPFTSP